MKIRTRLVLLLACLLAAFGLSAALLQRAHRLEAGSILASLQHERSDLLDRLLTLTGQSLRSFASDYSLWDEMVGFARSGDAGWARINIDASLANFNAQGAWVVRPDGSLLYAATPAGQSAPPPPPLENPAFLEELRLKKNLHFFQESPAGLLEMRTAPILPSDDLKREQAPRGWFIVARLWNEGHLGTLAEALQSRVTLGTADTPAENVPRIHLSRPLHDWQGRPLRVLRVTYESRPLALLLEGNKEEAYLLYLFGFLSITVVVVGVSRWVIRPLHRLGQSLESGRSDAIGGLQGNPDEFGHLARQITQSFVQRDALRDSEERLRHSLDLRSRLARDLHDGIIQSIYAAGLGLESVRKLPNTDPVADQRLAACQQMLNDTLWQVRRFIDSLEPETSPLQSPAQSLAALAASMQSLQSIPITAELDPALTGRIGPHQELHLLQMARELLSNALRHSGARQVRLAMLALPDGLARLEVSDDGNGFDPAVRTGTGRGLLNLAARTREIDAQLEIDSTPGKGARITVRFRPLI
ncbi:Signal transduction histidine kinase [uncultured Defluviicoccus sp.]|uniref:Signal transduction histidine kinase n=1 Tax=metagenome TaxID=256318 RepID=A0A380TIL2_9ZZZZ|nr:Signal transduction histidine kinase [uncultured Defluviicoccus sp.]